MTCYFADSDYSGLVRLLLMTCNQSHCCWPHIECLDVLIFSSPLSVPIAELCVLASISRYILKVTEVAVQKQMCCVQVYRMLLGTRRVPFRMKSFIKLVHRFVYLETAYSILNSVGHIFWYCYLNSPNWVRTQSGDHRQRWIHHSQNCQQN